MQVVIFFVIIVFVLVREAEAHRGFLLLREGALDGLIVYFRFFEQQPDRVVGIAQQGQQHVLGVGLLSFHGTCLEEGQLDDASCGIAEQRLAVL